jgi:L-ascorbate metabolism protein UlaG (beta-lactamase superfamily)
MVLLTHMHGDHLGDLKLKAPGAGSCANSERLPAPNSTTAEVVAAKNAAMVMTRAIGGFVGNKVEKITGGKPIGFCPQTGGATTVPVATICASQTDLGGVFVAKTAGATQGVEIAIVYASHVVKFSNGLVAYLSGDTGIHSEMKTVVNEYHKANLTVLNLGPNPGIFYSGGHAINELLRPASVILTHANEPVTEGGKLRPASRTAAFMKLLKPASHLALSERTMEFDGKGKCVAGC